MRAVAANILPQAVEITIYSTLKPTQQIRRGKREVHAAMGKLKNNRTGRGK